MALIAALRSEIHLQGVDDDIDNDRTLVRQNQETRDP
jgi:hypothetical protein